MKFWVYLGLGIIGLWLQVTLAPSLSIVGVRPNLLLISVLLLGMRWRDPWLFIYAVPAGLAMDTFSHGLLGLYGITFFVISFFSQMAGEEIYDNQPAITSLLVLGLSLTEGVFSLIILEFIDSRTVFWEFLLTSVLPASLYNAILAPFLVMGLIQLERTLKMDLPV